MIRQIVWIGTAVLGVLMVVACGAPPNPTNLSVENELAVAEPVASELDEASAAEAAAPSNSGSSISAVPLGPAAPLPDGASLNEAGLPVGFTEEGRPYIGNLDAPVVIEEFSDFQCPFCGRFAAQTLPSLLTNQIARGEAVLIYYDFPLNIHPQAVPASVAARCAGVQGAAAYWEMHDLLFANIGEWQRELTPAFVRYAEQIGLDGAAFTGCLDERAVEFEALVQADFENGRSRGVSSTPSFFINNQPLVGAQPLAVFNSAIATIMEGGEIASADEPDPAALPTPVPLTDENAAFALGNPDAGTVIIEYSDFQCPFCREHTLQTMPAVIQNLVETGRVYYVFKDFPLDNLHPQARAAAAAARCAGEQEAYLEMHDALFENVDLWSVNEPLPSFEAIADSLGLDGDTLVSCVESGRYDDAIQLNVAEGANFGVNSTPSFFVGGFPLVGARPYDIFELAVGLNEEGTLAEAYAPPPQQQQQPEAPSRIEQVDIGESFALGDPNAPITMIEFTDYQCPFCGRHHAETFEQIRENFIETGQVYYVFKDFPLTSIHPQAVEAAEAARCAGDQGSFLAMHGSLFANQRAWSVPNPVPVFANLAGQLGMDVALFEQCMSSGVHETAVNADLEEAIGFGLRSTPSFVINGEVVAGALPYEMFEQGFTGLLGTALPEE